MKAIGFVFVLAPLTASAMGKPQLTVVCTPPPSITVTAVNGEEKYSSTYKLFGSNWEEIDTESPYEPIPEHLHVSNSQLHAAFIKKCKKNL